MDFPWWSCLFAVINRVVTAFIGADIMVLTVRTKDGKQVQTQWGYRRIRAIPGTWYMFSQLTLQHFCSHHKPRTLLMYVTEHLHRISAPIVIVLDVTATDVSQPSYRNKTCILPAWGIACIPRTSS